MFIVVRNTSKEQACLAVKIKMVKNVVLELEIAMLIQTVREILYVEQTIVSKRFIIITSQENGDIQHRITVAVQLVSSKP